MKIIKNKFWIIFFSLFILSGLLLEYYVNTYKRVVDLEISSDKYKIADFDINIFYDVKFNKNFLIIYDEGIKNFLRITLRDQLKNNSSNYNINNYEIKFNDQAIVNQDDNIILEDFIYAENNMDKKLSITITFLSNYNDFTVSFANIDKIYNSFKNYYSEKFDMDYKKRVVQYHDNSSAEMNNNKEAYKNQGFKNYKSQFLEMFLYIKTYSPVNPVAISIQNQQELDVLKIFLNTLGLEDKKMFINKTNIMLDFLGNFEILTNSDFENIDLISDILDKPLTSVRVGELNKSNFENTFFSGRTTFPLITLFFLILSIGIFLFTRVIKYK